MGNMKINFIVVPFALAMGMSMVACSGGNSSDSDFDMAIVDDGESSSESSSEASSFFDEGWRDSCLAKINEYRATENLEPLTLASSEKLSCANTQAAADLSSGKAHGHFGDCNEGAQNSGPNFSTSWMTSATAVSNYYLRMMWEDEKALVTSGERDPENDDDYSYIGHYLNMKGNYSSVTCSIALSSDGKTGWFNVDFFR